MICFALFRNGHFHNVVSTFTNVVHINVENDNVVSTLSNVVYINVEIHNVDSTLFDVANSNVEIHNVVSTLIWRCPTSRRRINQKTTLKQHWNVCWDKNTLPKKTIMTMIFTKKKCLKDCEKLLFNKDHSVKSVQIRSYFWSFFSCIRTEYGDLRSKSSYSVRIQENTEQK